MTRGIPKNVLQRALARESHERFDVIARLASKAVGSSVGLVSIVGEGGQTFPGAIGLPEQYQSSRETPLSHSFCQHVVASGRDLTIADARENPLVASNLAIRDLGVIAYAGVPLRDAGGKVVGSVCAIEGRPRGWDEADLVLLRDAANLATRELELLALREQLLAAGDHPEAPPSTTGAGMTIFNRLLDELTTSIQIARADQIRGAKTLAHELRTPLAVVLMLCEDLTEEHGAGPVADGVAEIAGCAREALDLLDAQVVETLSSWRTPKHEEPVDLADLFASLNVMLAPLANPGVALRVDIPLPGTRTLTTDPVKLGQVLRNLLSNALRVTDEGQVTLTHAVTPGGGLELAVADTGPGIEPGLIERIFDEGTRGPNPGSFGLGLPLSRTIMRGLGGDLTVTCEPGGGCTFTATLPS